MISILSDEILNNSFTLVFFRETTSKVTLLLYKKLILHYVAFIVTKLWNDELSLQIKISAYFATLLFFMYVWILYLLYSYEVMKRRASLKMLIFINIFSLFLKQKLFFWIKYAMLQNVHFNRHSALCNSFLTLVKPTKMQDLLTKSS